MKMLECSNFAEVISNKPNKAMAKAEQLRNAMFASVSEEDVREIVALENGDNPRYRIVLAGYWQEHGDAMPESWRCYRYSASKAYGTSTAVGNGKGNDSNRHNEALWYSPHCLGERTLF